MIQNDADNDVVVTKLVMTKMAEMMTDYHDFLL